MPINLKKRRHSSIEFSRVENVFDIGIPRATIVLVGCGGGRRKAELLAHLPIVGKLLLIDPDVVDERNPATQGHRSVDVGRPKVTVTAEAVRAINPEIEVVCAQTTWEQAAPIHYDLLAEADHLIAATDSYDVNRSIRKFAIAHGRDLTEAWIYEGGVCVEHVVTWPDILAAGGGCGTCHTKGRLDAIAGGFKNPRFVPTHVLAAELSCVQTVLIVASRLHQRAGSRLPIARLAERITARPFQLTRIDPGFWAGPGEPFADTSADCELFLTRSYDLDTPPGWVCPDCGTQRFVPAAIPAGLPHDATSPVPGE